MEREQLLKVMVPVGAFAVLLILVGAVIALNSGGGTPTSSAAQPPPDGSRPQPNIPADTGVAVGNFDFPLDGPEWKDLGGGLKVWEVKEGTGEACPTMAEKPNVWPVMHYSGWLTNGTLFDSSRTTGQPLDRYPLSELIRGWQQGVPGMKIGGVRRLLIPSDLGYGSRPSGKIPANSTLVFEMELVRFK